MIELLSFSYRVGVPDDYSVIDCRHLPNPHSVASLRKQNGTDEEVVTWLQQYEAFNSFVDAIAHQILSGSMRAAFGCVGGRHRSVAVAALVGHRAASEGCGVTVTHRELHLTQFRYTGDENGTQETLDDSTLHLFQRRSG